MSRKILVIEDDPALQELLEQLLLREGYAVEACRNGEEALDHAIRFKPALVILDWELPGINGPEIVKRLRSHPATANISVLMMSAHCRPSYQEDAMRAGVNDFIVKPFNLPDFQERIRPHLSGFLPLRKSEDEKENRHR